MGLCLLGFIGLALSTGMEGSGGGNPGGNIQTRARYFVFGAIGHSPLKHYPLLGLSPRDRARYGRLHVLPGSDRLLRMS